MLIPIYGTFMMLRFARKVKGMFVVGVYGYLWTKKADLGTKNELIYELKAKNSKNLRGVGECWMS